MKMTEALALLGPTALMSPDMLKALSGALDVAYFAILEGRVAAHWTDQERQEARDTIAAAACNLDKLRHVVVRAGGFDPEDGK